MSVRAFSWAIDQEVGDPTTKLVLMLIADHANQDAACWPRQSLLAEKAHVTERTVRRHIQKLEDEGYLVRYERRRKDGSRSSNGYRLVMDPAAEPEPQPDTSVRLLEGEQPDTGVRSNRTPASGTPGHGRPDLEPTSEPSKNHVGTARKRAAPLPGGWTPNDRHREIAKEEGVDCDRQAILFRDHAEATGRTLKDWDAGFRTWLRKARDFQPAAQAKMTREEEERREIERKEALRQRQAKRKEEERREEEERDSRMLERLREWYREQPAEVRAEIDDLALKRARDMLGIHAAPPGFVKAMRLKITEERSGIQADDEEQNGEAA